MDCDCGKSLPSADALQCVTCRRAALKKLLKLAAACGAFLGLICSQVPANYQTACKAVASLLGTC